MCRKDKLPKVPFICSNHFTENDYKRNVLGNIIYGKHNQPKLKDDAVPNVGLPQQVKIANECETSRSARVENRTEMKISERIKLNMAQALAAYKSEPNLKVDASQQTTETWKQTENRWTQTDCHYLDIELTENANRSLRQENDTVRKRLNKVKKEKRLCCLSRKAGSFQLNPLYNCSTICKAPIKLVTCSRTD
jgi:hypothetical protein